MKYKSFLCLLLSASLFCAGSISAFADEMNMSETETVSAAEDSEEGDLSKAAEAAEAISESEAASDAGQVSMTEAVSESETVSGSEPVTEENETSESTEPSENDSEGESETELESDTEIVSELAVTETAPTVMVSDPSNLTTSQAKDIIFKYLTETLGLNSAAACGIMANIERESSFKVTNVQDSFEKKSGYTDASYTAAVDDGSYTNFVSDGAGYGLVQWTYSGWKKGLLSLAQSSGTSIGDINTQLTFIYQCMLSNETYSRMTSVPNTAEGAYQAGYDFCYYFERPSNTETNAAIRGELARTSYWPVYGTGTDESSTGTGSSTDTTETSSSVYTVTASSLNVRSGADSSYDKLGSLTKGTTVKVLEKSGSWGKIVYNDSYGWISLSYCVLTTTASDTTAPDTTTTETTTTETSSTESATGTETSTTSAVYEVTASSLNVRSGGGTGYSIIGVLYKGDSITVTSVDGSWAQVLYNGETGYVSYKYLKKISDAVPDSNTSTESTESSESSESTESTGTSEASESTESAGTSENSSEVYKITASSLNVRSGAGTSYSIIGVLYKGDTISVASVNGSWAQVLYNGETGYVSYKYLEKVSDSVPDSNPSTESTESTESSKSSESTESTTMTSESTETAGTTENSSEVYKITASSLNIRSGAGSSYSIIGVLYKNAEVSVYEIVNNWGRISWNGEEGYIYMAYTQKESSSTDSNTSENTENTDSTETAARTELQITTQPKSVVVKTTGNTATFNIAAEGDGLSYKWYWKNAGTTDFVVSSCTSTSLSYSVTSARNGRLVYCVVTDQYGNQVKSNVVSMSIKGSLLIATQPQNVTVSKSGQTAKITVVAVGEGLTYKWYWKNSGGSSFSLSNTTSKTYSIAVTAARNGRQVYCVISDKYGNTVTTNTVTMSIAK